MSSGAAESPKAPLTAAGRSCIVGFGNPLRRDDGAGLHVVERLRERLGGRGDLAFLPVHQLEPDLVEDLTGAARVVMVDATFDRPPGGWRCEEIAPNLLDAPQVIHHVSPAFVMGLLSALYGEKPQALLVSIAGEDFGHGEGLSPAVKERVREVIAHIERVLSEKERKCPPDATF